MQPFLAFLCEGHKPRQNKKIFILRTIKNIHIVVYNKQKEPNHYHIFTDKTLTDFTDLKTTNAYTEVIFDGKSSYYSVVEIM